MKPSWEALEARLEAIEQRRARRTRLIAYGVAPVLAMLALVALGLVRLESPGFIREVEDTLNAIHRAQVDFRATRGHYAGSFTELGLALPAERHFTCFLGPEAVLPPTAATESVPLEELPKLVDQELGVTGVCPKDCAYLAACAARLPWNGMLSAWFISSQDGAGGRRKAGVVFSPGLKP